MSQAIEHILVSVIIPTYNRAQLLPEAIESVQVQTHTNLEIIVVDDCSSDNTEEVVRELMKDDSRIKYYRLSKKGNANVARNYGVEKSRGEYLSFLDSDDVYMPEKIGVQLMDMLEDEYDFVICQAGEYDENLKQKIKNWVQAPEGNLTLSTYLQDTKCNIPNGAVLWKKKYFNQVGCFDEELKNSQEWLLHFKALLMEGTFIFRNMELTKIRRHNDLVRIASTGFTDNHIRNYLKARNKAIDFTVTTYDYCKAEPIVNTLLQNIWYYRNIIVDRASVVENKNIAIAFNIIFVTLFNYIESKKIRLILLVSLYSQVIYVLITNKKPRFYGGNRFHYKIDQYIKSLPVLI